MVCGCSNNPKKADNVPKSVGTQQKKTFKAGKQKGNNVQYPADTTKKTLEALEAPANTTDKKMPEEPSNVVLQLPDTSKGSIFKNTNYKLTDLPVQWYKLVANATSCMCV